MLLSRPPKNEKLKSIVERFWSVDDPDAAGNETLLPSGKAQIIFGLSDIPFEIYGSQADPTVARAFQIFQGPASRPRHVGRRTQIALCGVAFTAGGAGTIHSRIDETSDRVIDLADLWSDDASDLRERLCNLQDEHMRLDFLEAEISKRVFEKLELAEIQKGIELLRNGHSIEETCDALGCTPFLFRKRFLRSVGFTPKHYLRIERFRLAVSQLEPQSSLADVAADSSFSDQAHMTREVSEFGRMTPGQLKSMVRPYPGHIPDD